MLFLCICLLNKEGVEPEEESAVVIALWNRLGRTSEEELDIFVHNRRVCQIHFKPVHLKRIWKYSILKHPPLDHVLSGICLILVWRNTGAFGPLPLLWQHRSLTHHHYQFSSILKQESEYVKNFTEHTKKELLVKVMLFEDKPVIMIFTTLNGLEGINLSFWLCASWK